MMIECIIFDFGNTLADEQWMLQSPADLPTWELAYRHGVWNRPMEWGEPWSRGELSAYDIAERMYNVLGVPTNRAYQIMLANCRKLRFFPNVMRYVRNRHQQKLKQAIVTINPDIFSDVVVPHYRLDTQFDVIVNSCDYGTLDKAELSQHVFAHYNNSVGFHNSLLIDNSQTHLDSFAAQGGATYLFTDDATFQADLLQNGVLPFQPQ
ncbi:MAG: hypothetical protein ACPG8W_22225 [Candidatus Promineifilaceae bacterium]